MEAEYDAKQNGAREMVNVAPEKKSVKDAVGRFLSSKRNKNLAESTLDKLRTIFEKQFMSWATESRLTHVEQITTADLESFRDTREDSPLAKKKKQERLIGFFYYCLRLGWTKSNPAVALGRIRADGPPTDYFPKHEFEQTVDARHFLSPDFGAFHSKRDFFKTHSCLQNHGDFPTQPKGLHDMKSRLIIRGPVPQMRKFSHDCPSDFSTRRPLSLFGFSSRDFL